MRLTRWMVAGLAAVSMAVLVPDQASATDTGPSQVLDVQVSPDAVDVVGLGEQRVTIRMHLVDPDGVATSRQYDAEDPFPRLTITPGTTRLPNGLPLQVGRGWTLASGSLQDGWWATTRQMGAAHAGVQRLVSVAAVDRQGNYTEVDLTAAGLDRAFEVRVTAAPTMTIGQQRIGYLGDPVTLAGRAYRADTGAPLVNVRVQQGWASFTSCLESGFDVGRYRLSSAVTDAQGNWSVRLAGGEAAQRVCFGPTTATEPFSLQEHGLSYLGHYLPEFRYRMWVKLASTSTAVGQPVQVDGSVVRDSRTPAIGRVELQRWSSHQWRTVGGAAIRRSGRFTLVASPPFPGNHLYRVVKPEPPGRGFVSTASTTMKLTAR